MEKNNTSFGIKQESIENSPMPKITPSSTLTLLSVIDLTSSESDSDSDSDSYSYSDSVDNGDASVNKKRLNENNNDRKKKKKKIDDSQASLVLPLGFLDPLPSTERNLSSIPSVSLALPAPPSEPKGSAANGVEVNSKQFWKAGDYAGAPSGDWESSTG